MPLAFSLSMRSRSWRESTRSSARAPTCPQASPMKNGLGWPVHSVLALLSSFSRSITVPDSRQCERPGRQVTPRLRPRSPPVPRTRPPGRDCGSPGHGAGARRRSHSPAGLRSRAHDRLRPRGERPLCGPHPFAQLNEDFGVPLVRDGQLAVATISTGSSGSRRADSGTVSQRTDIQVE